MALTGYHADEISRPERRPQALHGLVHLLPREAGSAGKDTPLCQQGRDVWLLPPRKDAPRRNTPASWRGRKSAGQGRAPYRVIGSGPGDLGTSAARKFDCEAWLPTQGATPESRQPRVRDQARRLGIHDAARTAWHPSPPSTERWPRPAGSSPSSRIISADGSVYVPEALRPYLEGSGSIPVA